MFSGNVQKKKISLSGNLIILLRCERIAMLRPRMRFSKKKEKSGKLICSIDFGWQELVIDKQAHGMVRSTHAATTTTTTTAQIAYTDWSWKLTT